MTGVFYNSSSCNFPSFLPPDDSNNPFLPVMKDHSAKVKMAAVASDSGCTEQSNETGETVDLATKACAISTGIVGYRNSLVSLAKSGGEQLGRYLGGFALGHIGVLTGFLSAF